MTTATNKEVPGFAAARPATREELAELAGVGASVSAAWVLHHLEDFVGERFDLPRLALSPLHPLDAAAQEAEQEAERVKALKPAPGAKPVKKATDTKEITVT